MEASSYHELQKYGTNGSIRHAQDMRKQEKQPYEEGFDSSRAATPA